MNLRTERRLDVYQLTNAIWICLKQMESLDYQLKERNYHNNTIHTNYNGNTDRKVTKDSSTL